MPKILFTIMFLLIFTLGLAQIDLSEVGVQKTFGLGQLRGVTYSPDGRLLASYGGRGVVLWSTDTWEVARILEHSDWVIEVAFSPNGKMLASGSLDKKVKLWEVSTGEILQSLEGHSKSVTSVNFSPDGNLLVSGSDNTIKLWEVSSGEIVRSLEGAFFRRLELKYSCNYDRSTKSCKKRASRILQ